MLASLSIACLALATSAPQDPALLDNPPRLPWEWGPAVLVSSEPAPVGQFGRSVDLDGDRLVIGASHEPGPVPYVGSASVFRRDADSWVEEARLEHPAPSAGAVFGTSVAMHGPWIAVGAPFDDVAGANAGAVHLFERGSGPWRHAATLVGTDSAPDDHFGISLAMHGDSLVVGAHGHDGAGLDAGAAYLFRLRAGVWSEVAVLLPARGSDGGRLGRRVAVDRRHIALAAPDDGTQGVDAGAVQVHRVRDGSLQAVLSVPGSSRLHFGASIAIEDGLLAVGATGDRLLGPFAGAVHVLELDGERWNTTSVVRGHDTKALDRFGFAVALEDGRLAVGAHRNDGWAPQAGAAYVFALGRTGASEVASLRPNQLGPGDLFGYALDLTSERLAVGAPLSGLAAYDAGAVFTFELP